jgi:hypothetical protein
VGRLRIKNVEGERNITVIRIHRDVIGLVSRHSQLDRVMTGLGYTRLKGRFALTIRRVSRNGLQSSAVCGELISIVRHA